MIFRATMLTDCHDGAAYFTTIYTNSQFLNRLAQSLPLRRRVSSTSMYFIIYLRLYLTFISSIATTNASHANTDHARIAKLDRENDITAPPKVDVSVGKAIQKGRQDKGLTQKELAQSINEKPQVVSRL